MEIIKLNKGADKICYKGYMYTLKYAGKQYYNGVMEMYKKKFT